MLCTTVGGDPSQSAGAFENHPGLDKRFSKEAGELSYKRMADLYEAHTRLYNAFSMHSNLGQFDHGTNDNPSIFIGGGEQDLPADATITLSMSKQEFVDLKMPAWDTMVIGGQNHLAFLKAWMAYQSYEIARIKVELIDAKSKGAAPETRADLEAEMAVCEKEIVAFLEAPGAD